MPAAMQGCREARLSARFCDGLPPRFGSNHSHFGSSSKIYGTNPLERLNGEIKRGDMVVGIFPNEDAITRPGRHNSA
jgi:transposase-like protein